MFENGPVEHGEKKSIMSTKFLSKHKRRFTLGQRFDFLKKFINKRYSFPEKFKLTKIHWYLQNWFESCKQEGQFEKRHLSKISEGSEGYNEGLFLLRSYVVQD